MASTLKHYALIAVAVLSLVFTPAIANAQYVQLSCSNGVSSGQFYYANQGTKAGACQYQGIQHIFGQILCNFVIILNDVLGATYCGIQSALIPILEALLTLYVAVFGVQIFMGTAQLNAKDIVIRLIKISCIWTFATQATWGVGYIFTFFFDAAFSGAQWVINSVVNPGALTCPGNTGVLGTNYMSIYGYLDCLIYQAILGPFTTANDKVTGFFICLMFFQSGIFLMVINWVITTLKLLTRTLMGLLLCLSAIAFLIALSPIFLSFMLFQSTMNFFEDWLKYLISYTLQILIVFAIISLWISAMSLFGGFFNELSKLIYPLQAVNVANVFNPNNTFGICKYTASYSLPGNPGQACVNNLPCLPSLQCTKAPAGRNDLLSPSQLQFDQTFIYFMIYNLTVLVVIAYTFNAMMEKAPEIARNLSGPATTPVLGSGFGMQGFGQLKG